MVSFKSCFERDGVWGRKQESEGEARDVEREANGVGNSLAQLNFYVGWTLSLARFAYQNAEHPQMTTSGCFFRIVGLQQLTSIRWPERRYVRNALAWVSIKFQIK